MIIVCLFFRILEFVVGWECDYDIKRKDFKTFLRCSCVSHLFCIFILFLFLQYVVQEEACNV